MHTEASNYKRFFQLVVAEQTCAAERLLNYAFSLVINSSTTPQGEGRSRITIFKLLGQASKSRSGAQ
jgi:hypothetical protein